MRVSCWIRVRMSAGGVPSASPRNQNADVRFIGSAGIVANAQTAILHMDGPTVHAAEGGKCGFIGLCFVSER